MKTMQFAPTRRAFVAGIGAFGLSLGASGEELAFDSKKMLFSNKAEANAFLKAPKRGDWDFARL